MKWEEYTKMVEDFDKEYRNPITAKELDKLCKKYRVYIWQKKDGTVEISSVEINNTTRIVVDGSWQRKQVKDFTKSDWIGILETHFS
jgi:hypothetical protein